MKLFRKFWKAEDRVKSVTLYSDELNSIARKHGLPECQGQMNVPMYIDTALRIIAYDAGVYRPHPYSNMGRGT